MGETMPVINKKIGDCKIRGGKIEDASSIAKYANNKKIWKYT